MELVSFASVCECASDDGDACDPPPPLPRKWVK